MTGSTTCRPWQTAGCVWRAARWGAARWPARGIARGCGRARAVARPRGAAAWAGLDGTDALCRLPSECCRGTRPPADTPPPTHTLTHTGHADHGGDPAQGWAAHAALHPPPRAARTGGSDPRSGHLGRCAQAARAAGRCDSPLAAHLSLPGSSRTACLPITSRELAQTVPSHVVPGAASLPPALPAVLAPQTWWRCASPPACRCTWRGSTARTRCWECSRQSAPTWAPSSPSTGGQGVAARGGGGVCMTGWGGWGGSAQGCLGTGRVT